MRSAMKNKHLLLIIILLLAFVLRLGIALGNDPMAKYRARGGDELWYLANGVGILTGAEYTSAHGIDLAPSSLPTAPLYLVFVGAMQAIFSPGAAIITIWIIQSALGAFLCFFGYDLAQKLTGTERAGIIAALLIAFSPALVLEPQYIATETLYMFFLMAGIWGYVRYLAVSESGSWGGAVGVGLVLGYATLTRAVSLLFPLGLAGLLLFAYPAQRRGKALRHAALMLLIYSLTVATWTAYNAVHYGNFVIASDQFTAVFWRGAVEGDASPQENDELLGGQSPGEQAAEIIQSDPTGFIQRRISEWSYAHLQPHGTIPLGGESLKELAQGWMDSGFSMEGLGELLQGEGFFPKLLIYLWHFSGYVLGVLGMLLTWRKWHSSLALIGFIIYTALLHLVLLALPRYIFPTHTFWLVFAAAALGIIWGWLRRESQMQMH